MKIPVDKATQKKIKFLGLFYGEEMYGNKVAEKALKQYDDELTEITKRVLRDSMPEFWNPKPRKSFIQRLLGK